MYCQSCGTAVPEHMRYCNRCGTQLVASEESGATQRLHRENSTVITELAVKRTFVLYRKVR
jgi:RNA polymerase subunit RPABC4/transcription elongation factor Spt4